ncbi:hypothetical protein [Parvularcula sp. LCG005]|uniref:hypothetical protein n=1 Tax=Parvularcula sp. LCG005 TaxID=3078805 RepID=UPI0029429DF0|nr:hypothetical protein [Parvularcula sp. LCG005]WOI54318.1 hypothetical protein RUI03_04780 [Parvularcula sp. LCG005]
MVDPVCIRTARPVSPPSPLASYVPAPPDRFLFEFGMDRGGFRQADFYTVCAPSADVAQAYARALVGHHGILDATYHGPLKGRLSCGGA